jgi:hypothetical protein
MKPAINRIATILEYREVFDRPARLEDLTALLKDLNVIGSAILLCQMNADFRLTKRNRDATAKMQQEIAGGMLGHGSDRMVQRYTHARPEFHANEIAKLPSIANMASDCKQAA